MERLKRLASGLQNRGAAIFRSQAVIWSRPAVAVERSVSRSLKTSHSDNSSEWSKEGVTVQMVVWRPFDTVQMDAPGLFCLRGGGV